METGYIHIQHTVQAGYDSWVGVNYSIEKFSASQHQLDMILLVPACPPTNSFPPNYSAFGIFSMERDAKPFIQYPLSSFLIPPIHQILHQSLFFSFFLDPMTPLKFTINLVTKSYIGT